ncbi:hypothetical protein WN48_07580 [Eufriesea mexicana]|uniref:Uncharacterized protein n=1 Tax=Eufriesea mexicana TaxID=516756 RepID=A0A310SJ86_9HYME|nr:hypothetical protein WN48_07580 [Eufriesea mexicana]
MTKKIKVDGQYSTIALQNVGSNFQLRYHYTFLVKIMCIRFLRTHRLFLIPLSRAWQFPG